MNKKNAFLFSALLLLFTLLLFGCIDTSPEAQKIRSEVALREQQISSSPKITELNNCITSFSKLVDNNSPTSDLNAKLNECEIISTSITTDLNEFKNYLTSQKGKISDQFDKELDNYYNDVIDAFLTIKMPLAQMALTVDPCAGPTGKAICQMQKNWDQPAKVTDPCATKQMNPDCSKWPNTGDTCFSKESYALAAINQKNPQLCCGISDAYYYADCYGQAFAKTDANYSSCFGIITADANGTVDDYGVASTIDFCLFKYALEYNKILLPEGGELTPDMRNILRPMCDAIQDDSLKATCKMFALFEL